MNTTTTRNLEIELTDSEYLTLMSALKVVQSDFSDATALELEHLRTKIAEASLEADRTEWTEGPSSKLFTPKPLTRADHDQAQRYGVEEMDDGRIRFVLLDGKLSHDWSEADVRPENDNEEGRPISLVWIRRASCGEGCFCGAEFTFTNPAIGGSK